MKYKNLFIDLDDTLWDTSNNNKECLKEIYADYPFHQHYPSFETFFDDYMPNNLQLWAQYRKGEINKETLKQETIKKVENRAIALVNNKIVYATGTQLKMMSLNGKDDQILFKNIVVSDLQVLGSDLFTKGYVQESGVKYIVFNIKGQYKALNENTAQEFENLQDA